MSESLEYIVPSYTSDLCLINTDSALDISNEYYKYIKIGPSGLSCFKDMDICHVISCTSCESKGDFVEHLSCYKLHQL